jgi:hypothetical protein
LRWRAAFSRSRSTNPLKSIGRSEEKKGFCVIYSYSARKESGFTFIFLMLSKSAKHRLLEQAGMRLLQYCHGKEAAQTGLNELLQAHACGAGLGRDGAAVASHLPVFLPGTQSARIDIIFQNASSTWAGEDGEEVGWL